jgi:hypothetical protein
MSYSVTHTQSPGSTELTVVSVPTQDTLVRQLGSQGPQCALLVEPLVLGFSVWTKQCSSDSSVIHDTSSSLSPVWMTLVGVHLESSRTGVPTAAP